jgi:PDZ domain-containing secreted protein
VEARREADRKEAEMRQKMADMQIEQMKMQMQANMNLNLASQNQAHAAAPIVINNNNNNNNNNVTGGGGGNMSEDEKNKAKPKKTPAEEAAAKKAAAEKAAAVGAKVVVYRVAKDAPASELLKRFDRVLTINGVEATEPEQAVGLFAPTVGEVVFYVLRGKEIVTVTMHKPQADMKLGVELAEVFDPALEKAERMFFYFFEDPEYGLLTSAGLQEKMSPIYALEEELNSS